MGNTSSIFYPDNGNRRNRAQQLADDCKYAQDQYDAAKKEIEGKLGPYKEKLDKVLKAFDCNNIDDLDRLVLQNATGDALAHWNRTRENYDKSLIVDQVIMAAEGIVTIVGVVVSIIGAATGGFGFFVGIGVTTDILLILGLLGAIYDIINGAVQRSKLRDAINSLVPTRIKAKYAQMQMEQLLKSLPAIQAVYQAFEEAGYNKDKILAKFKDGNWLKSLKTETKKITYRSAGQELADMDSRRGSWTNEDPNWQAIADSLDSVQIVSLAAKNALMAETISFVSLSATTKTDNPLRTGNDDLVNPDIASLLNVDKALMDPPPPYNGKILIRFVENGIAPILQKTFHVTLEDFVNNNEARVRVNTEGDQETLVADFGTNNVKLNTLSSSETTPWIVGFANEADAAGFATHGPDFDLSRRPQSVGIRLRVGDRYLTKDGLLTTVWQQSSTELIAAYA